MAPLKLETAMRAFRGSLFDMISPLLSCFPRSDSTEPLLPAPLARSYSSLATELHHGPSHDVAGSQQVELLVDLVERAWLERVKDLAPGHERQNFADVGVVAPERAV